jgi:hypothetical protein
MVLTTIYLTMVPIDTTNNPITIMKDTIMKVINTMVTTLLPTTPTESTNNMVKPNNSVTWLCKDVKFIASIL